MISMGYIALHKIVMFFHNLSGYQMNWGSTFLFRLWTVENGIVGETCMNQNTTHDELWCDSVNIPDCVDRTIKCSDPPLSPPAYSNPDTELTWYKPPDNRLNQMPEPLNNENGTRIEYKCPGRRYFFDYPYNASLSYYYTENINYINATCTKEGCV